jgi:hypothetical protein
MVRRDMFHEHVAAYWIVLAWPWMALAADSVPIVLFAVILFWWYSD